MGRLEEEGEKKEWSTDYYLKIICNKAVHNRIHTAIQTTECDSQVVHDHMIRHIWVEIHHHLQHRENPHIMLLHTAKTCQLIKTAR